MKELSPVVEYAAEQIIRYLEAIKNAPRGEAYNRVVRLLEELKDKLK